MIAASLRYIGLVPSQLGLELVTLVGKQTDRVFVVFILKTS